MNEILKKLLESELLNEQTKTELSEAFEREIEQVKAAAREEAINEAKVEFATKYAEDKAALVEAVDSKLTTMLKDEIEELREDIERFRDLEAEYAQKLIEAKEEMSLKVKAELTQLVEALDAFIEERTKEEFEELRESIEEVKKINYAKKLFESIEDTFKEKFFNESGIAKKLEENQKIIETQAKKLHEAEKKLNKLTREKEMERVLENLHGRPREIMEAILRSFETEKLEEAYNKFIGRVLHGSVEDVKNQQSEKESVKTDTSVLAENDSTIEQTPITETDDETVIVNGDSKIVEHEIGNSKNRLDEVSLLRIKRMAGIL